MNEALNNLPIGYEYLDNDDWYPCINDNCDNFVRKEDTECEECSFEDFSEAGGEC